MSITAKIKIWATIAAAVGVYAAFQTATGSLVSDDDNYALSVKWEPGVLSIQRPVNITVTVDGVPIISRIRHVSPWHETMTAVKGSKVRLSASTIHPGLYFMDCLILANGSGSVQPGMYKAIHAPADPSSVECTA